MDNKLSELGKPVGFIEQSGMDYLRSGADADIWPDDGRGDDIPLYSQEYVSALKHESAVNWEAAASLNVENQELKKRIAELETIRADASQVFKEIGNELGCNPDNESIMMTIDALKEREKRVVALAGGNAELWETMAARLEAAEAKLATPIQIVNYDEFFICHVSGASDDYCKGWVDGRNAAARDVVKAGFTVEDKQ